jgi:ribosomal protein L28
MHEKKSAIINVGHRRMIHVAMQLFTTGKQENNSENRMNASARRISVVEHTGPVLQLLTNSRQM